MRCLRVIYCECFNLAHPFSNSHVHIRPTEVRVYERSGPRRLEFKALDVATSMVLRNILFISSLVSLFLNMLAFYSGIHVGSTCGTIKAVFRKKGW